MIVIIIIIITIKISNDSNSDYNVSNSNAMTSQIPSLHCLLLIFSQFGGQRGYDPSEEHHLMSMLGSGPFTNSSGSGFYSRSTYQEILRHARSRHVEVIPEFD